MPATSDPPYRPQTNGKSERFNRTLLDEWAYVRMYRSNDERLRALAVARPVQPRRAHSALGGLTPMEVLVNNVFVNHT